MAVTGLVLAGGKSSRMKTNKAELLFGDKTLQQRSVDLLHSVGLSDVLISRNGCHANADYLPDIYPNRGPLGGIYSALKHTANDLLVVAIDMPLLNRALLTRLLNFYEQQKIHNKTMNLAHFSQFPLPIYINNNQVTQHYLRATLSAIDSNCSIKQFIKTCHGESLASSQTDAFSNINTPVQYSQLCKTHGINQFKKEVINHD